MRINAITQPLNAELRRLEASKKTEKETRAKSSASDKTEFSADAKRFERLPGPV